jgi:hypothetical protein
MEQSARRVALATTLAAMLVSVVVTLPRTDRPGDDRRTGDHRALTSASTAADDTHVHPAALDGHAHDHNDPATKNALSRAESGPSTQDPSTQDPTTQSQARENVAYATAARAATEPTLTTVPLRSPRRLVPESRYAPAGGCYTLAGRPVRFQATDLGRYLLQSTGRTVLAAGRGSSTAWVAKPSTAADWIVHRRPDARFTFRLSDGRQLRRVDGVLVTGATPTSFTLQRTTGCSAYPEIAVNITGLPHAGVTPFQEVRGYADPHTHGMTHEFLGGRVICSPPWHRYGVAYALRDCPDHELLDGRGAVLEDFLSDNPPGTGHDPVGWPTFGYWPNPHSLTHQQLYYKWLERSWRGGLRIFTSLLTENNVLCELYPLKKNSCNDMDAVRLQAADMRKLERYVDGQHGGPGKGWYRIVTTPFEARRVINQGKLAVVMGIETSVPFGCHVKAGIPLCSKAKIDAGLAEVRRLGVSQMEILNKFDNALTGVAGDGGTTGTITNAGNLYNTGSFLQMETCPAAYPDGVEDREQGPLTAPAELPAQDAIFGGIGQLFGLTGQLLPIYPTGPHCNKLGLTPLGRHLLNRMIDQHLLFDPDHMSVHARKEALDLYEQAARDGRHPGIISSHSWSTPDAYPRIYRLGGFVAPYAGDSTGFVKKWRQHLTWADRRFYFGFGYGADMNGFGAQGNPRGADVANPVTYPFTGLNGVRVERQRSGQRVFDINADGVSHYGLYPDWIQDVKTLAGADGTAFAADMARGAEAYLQTWERAFGIDPDSCRNPGQRKSVATVRSRVTPGMTTLQVMRAVGQPWTRLGSTYGICARTATEARVRMDIRFTAAGRVVEVRRVG